MIRLLGSDTNYLSRSNNVYYIVCTEKGPCELLKNMKLNNNKKIKLINDFNSKIVVKDELRIINDDDDWHIQIAVYLKLHILIFTHYLSAMIKVIFLYLPIPKQLMEK